MSGPTKKGAEIYPDATPDTVPETEALIPKGVPNFTKLRRVFVVALCSVTLILEGVNLSLPGPFFPREAKIKGLNQFQIGLVVGSFDLTNLCFSFVVASLVTPKNIKFVFITGTLWSSITVSSFGLLSESPKGDVFFYSCLITRMFNGAGAAMLYGTAMPIAVQMFPEKAALVTTIIQTSIGCGLCLGPPIGSFLLPLGGYKVPFLVVGVTELLVFTFSSFVIPNESVKTKSKVRSSDYVRFLGKFSTLSVVIPTATLYFIPGIRDTAYSLYFENVLAVDSKKIGYVFLVNSLAFLTWGPITGVFVEMGLGSIVEVCYQIAAPVIAFALFLPKFVPQLETLAWGVMILALNGMTMASTMNPAYLILEKIAVRQGFTNMQQVKTLIASSYNLATSSGRTFGAFVIGGYVNEMIGFYNMCFCLATVLTVTATWNVVFLFRCGLVGRLYYDSKLEKEAKEEIKEATVPINSTSIECHN